MTTLSSSSTACAGVRGFHSSRGSLGLEEFFLHQSVGRTGRSWRSSELRLKSFEDLQKLWFVLLKERNMLATLKHQCDVSRAVMPNPERIRKVRKSMAHIKAVLGERYLEVKEKSRPPQRPPASPSSTSPMQRCLC